MLSAIRRVESVVAVVLAGGAGNRLSPLTLHRSKPAVPFGGRYRVVDFVLSNLVNSGVERIYVLTQYKAQSLLEHLHRAWIRMRGRDSFLVAVPAQMQEGRHWYGGTADAVRQNLHLMHRTPHRIVAVFGADHIYKMNVRQMVDFHCRRRSSVTVACIPVPLDEASEYGVIEVDDRCRIVGFEEKPAHPRHAPGDPDVALVSMGNYLFDSQVLERALFEDGGRLGDGLDFGHDVIPKLVETDRVLAYDFRRNRIPDERHAEAVYWRDIGTIDAFFEANLDLKNVQPHLNLYNWGWPIRTASFADPPAKFVFDESGRRGEAVQSVVAGGSIIAGARVKDSVIGRNVFIDAGAEVSDAVIHDNVTIGPWARVRRAIVDKNARIPAGAVIGPDVPPCIEGAITTESGITVVPRFAHPPEHAAAREY